LSRITFASHEEDSAVTSGRMRGSVPHPESRPVTNQPPTTAPTAAPAARRPRTKTAAAAPVGSATTVATDSLSAALVELAHSSGVATEFWDWQGRHVRVSRATLEAVLAAMGVDASTDAAVAASLAHAHDRAWRRPLPLFTVAREGAVTLVPVHVDHGEQVQAWVELEDSGQRRDLAQEDRWVDPRPVDGGRVGEATFAVPADLPLGWHTLCARTAAGVVSRPLVVVPAKLELPAALARERAWGLMTQLYSVRSRLSWGLGDIADLAELCDWSAREHGAGFILVNPMNAAEPVPPLEPSPYLPTTRRFFNPIYLRIENIREVGYMRSTDRALVEWQAEEMRALNPDPAELDRDAVWVAKMAALEAIHREARTPARQAAFERYCMREGLGLVDFATWCAFAERYGLPDTGWPVQLQDPRSAATAAERDELEDRVQFHMWLQWCLDEQLADAQALALDAGMPIGIVHDLPVGAGPGDPGGGTAGRVQPAGAELVPTGLAA
jgi:4-alpha-glucanotransferase